MAIRTRRGGGRDNLNLVNFLSTCDGVVQDVARLLRTDHSDVNYVDSSLLRIQTLATNLNRVCHSHPENTELLRLVQLLQSDIKELKSASSGTAYKATRTIQGSAGPPSYDITRDQLEFFLELGFKGTDMAKMLQVSRSTVMRRLRFFTLSISDTFTVLSDDELDLLIKPMVVENPYLGYRSVKARLRSLGHVFQEGKVREALIRCDPTAAALRWSDTIHRRKYCVAGPNSLWHIDGNHKLIRWRFVIHGGIDGFSRLIVFMGVATNNKSSTVFDLFLNATTTCGLPSRVRTDHGGENVDVANFMVLQRGPGRGSIIQGRSVHNQRIERLWLDLFKGCTNVFYDLFTFLEAEHILNIENEKHIFALHFVFIPKIQASLQIFLNQWNNHKLSSENGKTPNQLFLKGVLQQYHSESSVIKDLFNEIDDDFGIDWGGPVPDTEDENIEVTIPETQFHLLDTSLQELRTQVFPLLENRNDFGISEYLVTLDYLDHYQQ
ncbi:uncharacterized protein LOC127734390 [Mytilus californianus]|uniref:uncharacterized protein LOC127734390 n=1 Tax=Mytilus californianus TaxID=6549 RepID=UPI002248619D|nr:uncharacterized protein LOC127734390 [Mytilus californianus]